MRARVAWAAAAAMVLASGCGMKVHRVQMDPARLVARPHTALACAYRLDQVVDARPSTGRAGGLGRHLFLVEDAGDLLRKRLEAIGLSSAATHGDAVDAELLHLYMTQNTISKVPVLVVRVTVRGAAPLLLRSQRTSMNWNGTEDEAYRAFAAMFDDVSAQLVIALNDRCAAKG